MPREQPRMNPFPYMPLFWNDFLSDNKVRVMSNEELGAYLRLLGAAWHEDVPGTLFADDDDLARLAGVELSLWKKLSRRILPCFVLNEKSGRYEQKRMIEEYKKCSEQAEMKHARATAGARKRWGKPKRCLSNAQAMLKHRPSNANHNHNHVTSSKDDVGGAANESPPLPRVPANDHELWIESLCADPTYAWIDVRRELGKMKNWCSQNGKQATPKRFINWLNRIDKPMSTTSESAKNGTSANEPITRKNALR